MGWESAKIFDSLFPFLVNLDFLLNQFTNIRQSNQANSAAMALLSSVMGRSNPVQNWPLAALYQTIIVTALYMLKPIGHICFTKINVNGIFLLIFQCMFWKSNRKKLQPLISPYTACYFLIIALTDLTCLLNTPSISIFHSL